MMPEIMWMMEDNMVALKSKANNTRRRNGSSFLNATANKETD